MYLAAPRAESTHMMVAGPPSGRCAEGRCGACVIMLFYELTRHVGLIRYKRPSQTRACAHYRARSGINTRESVHAYRTCPRRRLHHHAQRRLRNCQGHASAACERVVAVPGSEQARETQRHGRSQVGPAEGAVRPDRRRGARSRGDAWRTSPRWSANNGSLAYIREKLGDAYSINHTLVKASDLGFGHERKRFFCVLLRNDFELDHARFAPEPLQDLLDVGAEPPRTIAAREERWAAEIKAYGNSVVPACLFYAALTLLGFRLPRTPGVVSRKLVLDPAAYAPAEGATLSSRLKKEGLMKEAMKKKLWATPRASDSAACHFLTQRASHDLSSQIRFERGTAQEARGWSINPDFLRHLMGFPPGFLDAAPQRAPSAPAPHLAPAADVRFTCGAHRFEAHDFLLKLRAPGLAEVLETTADVKAVGATTMKRVLEWVYTGCADGLDEDVMEMFQMVDGIRG